MPALVSIVVTSYNKAPYLEQSVQSVLDQTYPEIECLIVDDGSTDNTREVGERLAATYSRVSYYYKTNGGISSARNFSFPLFEGEWVQFLDADDWIAEDKIEAQLKCLQDYPRDRVVFYSDYERVFMDRDDTILNRTPYHIGQLSKAQLMARLLVCPDFLADSPFPLLQQTMLMSRDLFREKSFDESLKACEDREFVLNLLHRDVPFVHVPIVGAFYRKHQSNLTDRGPLMRASYARYFELVRQRYPDLLPLCQKSIHFLLEKTLEEKDRQTFHQVLPLVTQFPVPLFEGKVKAANPFILRWTEQLRQVLPNFLLYERYRGPRSKRAIATLSRLLGSTRASDSTT